MEVKQNVSTRADPSAAGDAGRDLAKRLASTRCQTVMTRRCRELGFTDRSPRSPLPPRRPRRGRFHSKRVDRAEGWGRPRAASPPPSAQRLHDASTHPAQATPATADPAVPKARGRVRGGYQCRCPTDVVLRPGAREIEIATVLCRQQPPGDSQFGFFRIKGHASPSGDQRAEALPPGASNIRTDRRRVGRGPGVRPAAPSACCDSGGHGQATRSRSEVDLPAAGPPRPRRPRRGGQGFRPLLRGCDTRRGWPQPKRPPQDGDRAPISQSARKAISHPFRPKAGSGRPRNRGPIVSKHRRPRQLRRGRVRHGNHPPAVLARSLHARRGGPPAPSRGDQLVMHGDAIEHRGRSTKPSQGPAESSRRAGFLKRVRTARSPPHPSRSQ